MSELEVIFVFFLGIFIGCYIGSRFAYTRVANLLVQEIDEIEKEESANKKSINIYVQVEDGMIFAYNSDTNEFLANAQTGSALVEKLKLRFPGKTYVASQEDVEKIFGNKTL
jgi:hypothetical protein